MMLLMKNNIDFFLVDFKIFMIECVKAKMLNRIACQISGEEEIGLELRDFHWIEDGKHIDHGTIITSYDGSVKIDVNEVLNQFKQ
jgi:hypothetical protein